MIKFLQQGGQVDQVGQVIEALASDDQELIMQGIQAISQIGNPDEVVTEIANRAQKGDEKAIKATQTIQNYIQAQQAKAQKAAQGAKLQYIKKLQGLCPEGYEAEYFKAGGKLCSKCTKKQSKPESKKVTKECGGGISKVVNAFKAKCGGKVKKNEMGGPAKQDSTKVNKDQKIILNHYTTKKEQAVEKAKNDAEIAKLKKEREQLRKKGANAGSNPRIGEINQRLAQLGIED